MRNRGKIYWEWANSELHSRNYDERLPCGTLINIQARLSLENVTQLFLGIYGKKKACSCSKRYTLTAVDRNCLRR